MKDSRKAYRTTYIFNEVGSFFTGFFSTFKISGHNFHYEKSSTAHEADKRAIENDWGIVGEDIKHATTKYRKTNIK